MSVNMARPLQLLSLFSRLGARSVTPSVSVNACRLASRRVSKAWTGQSQGGRASRYSEEMSDQELGPEDVEDVEDKLQALVDQGRKRQKTVKYHILRRQMTPSGAPHRNLTWDAIEQIRYLKREQPDEWTVERLAEGFSVPPDVILRLLRSTFVPTPQRKAKQDAKIMAGLGQRVLPSGAAGTGQDRLKLPGNRTPAALASGGGRESAVVPVAQQQTLKLLGEGSGSLANCPTRVTVLPAQPRAGVGKEDHLSRSTEEEDDSVTDTNPTEEGEGSWDGRVLTDQELEEFLHIEKPSPVVQVGNDFLDAEGNFLYRI